MNIHRTSSAAEDADLQHWLQSIPESELLAPESVAQFITDHPGVKCRMNTIATSVSSILHHQNHG